MEKFNGKKEVLYQLNDDEWTGPPHKKDKMEAFLLFPRQKFKNQKKKKLN